MSEYQYYEFQAVDRPLDEEDRKALRALSTRARITTTSFINHYNWGDLRADPAELVERWFDLHLYLANWGTRRLMMRLPKRLVAPEDLEPFLRRSDPGGRAASGAAGDGCGELARVVDTGEWLLLDVHDDGEARDYDDDDAEGWLAALGPLRSDLLSGDYRLLYLIWLAAVGSGLVRDDALEPLAGLGPMTAGLQAFADFFRIDPDLVRAAAEASPGALEAEAVRIALKAIPAKDMTDLLERLVAGDPHVTAELKSRVRRAVSPASEAPDRGLRTASHLRSRMSAIAAERRAAEAKQREAERERQRRLDESARRARLEALRRRGDGAWREVETEIGRRNPRSYERAATLLLDLKSLAERDGTAAAYDARLRTLRERHASKKRFIERLAASGLG